MKNGYIDPLMYTLSYSEMANMQNMMYFIEFDIAKDYKIYFPDGNYTKIIKHIK